MNITEKLKEIREKNALTMKEVAESVGLNPATYRNYESGRLEPNLTTLCKLADFYHVTADYLLGREDEKNTTIETLSREFNMTDLERNIVKKYLELSDEQRVCAMEFLKQVVETSNETLERKTVKEDLADEISRLLAKVQSIK